MIWTLRISAWLKHTITEHRWPLLAWAPFAVAFEWLSDDAQLIVPVVAFAVGMILAPRHVWVLWGSFAMLWILGSGIWLLFNSPHQRVVVETDHGSKHFR